MCFLPVSCGQVRGNGHDGAVKSRAEAVAKAASKELSLKPAQTVALEEAVYELYVSIGRQDGHADDPSATSEMNRRSYKAFQDRISRSFPKEKAVEVLAWYYNYSNTNQQL